MKDLTKGNEASLIFKFSLPMLIGNIFQQFYQVTDSIIVGRFIGKEALGAVGASFPIIFVLVSFIIGISMGFSVLVSQCYGAKDTEKLKKSIDTCYITIFIGSLIVTIIGIYCNSFLLDLLKTPEDIKPLARVFINITFAGVVFVFGINAIAAVLRGLGNSKTPLYFLAASTVLNAILAYTFVVPLKLGIAGSAYATLIAEGFALFLGIIYLRKSKQDYLHLRIRKMKFDYELFKKGIGIGMPSGIQHVLIGAGMMTLNSIVNKFGTDVFAGFTAAMRLESFATMPALSLSMGISMFVGQNMGAGKPERVRKGYHAALAISGIISLITSLSVMIFGKHLISIFSTDINVINAGANYFLITGAAYIMFSILFITNGVMRGAGDTFIPMIVTIIALWGIRIPLSYILSDHLGANGIWAATPIAWTCGAALVYVYYLSGRWKRKVVVSKPVAVIKEVVNEVL